MDKVLDLFVTNEAAKRVINALVRQGLMWLGGVLAAKLTLGSDFDRDWKEMVEQVVALAVPALIVWWTFRRAKTTQKTIEVAGVLPAGTSREVVDAVVKAEQKSPGTAVIAASTLAEQKEHL